MRVVYIAAGAGGMYCGACARDAVLVRGLRTLGHDVILLPLYTPMRLDLPAPLPMTRVFFNGINACLQQSFAAFRRVPALIDRLIDNPALLRWVSGFAIETRPQALGPLTVSMLAGQDGRQRKELDKLLDFLEAEERPEVITLTNSMLSGLAPALHQRLGVPITCTLQGEDSFIDAIPEPYRTEAQQLIRRNATHIAAFIAPGAAYADRMATFLDVPRERIQVIRAGIEVDTYRASTPRHREPFTIGYLSVITPGKGLDLLVEAWRQLVNERQRDVVLQVAGRVLNPGYWRSVQRVIARAGLRGRFTYHGEVDLAGKVEFLQRSSVFVVPSRFAEARGMAVMEALAAGVPVVVPHAGIFPEMLALTGGGVLVPPHDAAALTEVIGALQNDPERADELGRAGADGMPRHFGAARMAAEVADAYTGLLLSAV